MQTYRDGSFRSGAIIARLAYKEVASEENNQAVGAFEVDRIEASPRFSARRVLLAPPR